MAAPADAEPDVAGPEDPPARRRLGWVGLGVAALAFLCGLVAATLLGATYAIARDLDQDEATRDLGFAVVNAAGLWVGFLGVPLLWARRQGGASRFLGLGARWVDVPLGLAVGLASTVVTAVVSSAVLTTKQQEVLESKAEEVVDRASGPVGVTVLIVALCLVTPLAEEVFFRGLLFRSLHRVTRLLAAIPIAGLIFGLVHYDGESVAAGVVAVQLGLLSLFGAALCGLVHRTGRLAASVVAHAAFNAVTVVSLLAQR